LLYEEDRGMPRLHPSASPQPSIRFKLEISAVSDKFIGVDLGGTNIKAGIVDLKIGKLISIRSTPTLAREGHESVMQRIAGLIDELIASSGLSREEFGGVGIGVPGVLDLEEGLVLFLPNLPGTWPKVPLARFIQDKMGLPVRLLNDARAITLGEWKFGAGRGVDTLACFAIGTGIGGGLVINGALHLGIGGTAGELGHQIIDYNGPLCGCGNRGCLEAYASGPAIAAMGIKAVIQGQTTAIGALVDHDLNRISPKVIYQAASQGDRVAIDIFAQAGEYIGIAAANVLASIGPRKVVIAGGVASAGELLLESIRSTIRQRVFIMPANQVEILQAELGNNAGVMGVALWASLT
jgi:glucokinase